MPATAGTCQHLEMAASPAADLLAAISADPDDEAPQLVIADWLLASGDPRGELIILDHHDRTVAGGLTDPDAIERLLLLSAEYSFPRARPDDPMLPFVGGGGHPVQYEVDFAGHHYYVRYRHHSLSVSIDDGAVESAVEYPDGFEEDLDLPSSGEWSDDETAVILQLLSDAIRAGTPLPELVFPYMSQPLPVYDGGPLRGYRLPAKFTTPRGIARDRYGLAARDYHRWHWIWHRAPTPYWR
ncbi:MAG: TIGR02996 domain-containing protein [Myxococcota bacterium]|nr:TIGR02996 domain-containing protein [Myxococcota bacterium]